MGVMACDRRGCEHILCERVILKGQSYICEECYTELRFAKTQWPSEMTAAEVQQAIETFMETWPGSKGPRLNSVEIDDEFRRLTGGD